MLEHLNANYDDWKSQYNSPSSSEEEAEAEAVSTAVCLWTSWIIDDVDCFRLYKWVASRRSTGWYSMGIWNI